MKYDVLDGSRDRRQWSYRESFIR